jgi:hypothetical protein
MSSFKKTLLLASILGGIFMAIPVFAVSQSNWQRIPLNTLEFNWFQDGTSTPPYYPLDTYTATSTDGYRYWNITPENYGVWKLEASTTWQTIPVSGYKWWIFADVAVCGTLGEWTTITFYYQWLTATSSGSDGLITPTFINQFSVGDKIIKSCTYQFLRNYAPIQFRYITFSFYNIGSGADIFMMIYTDEDLSYINTKEEFYNYLNTAYIYYVEIIPPEELQALITLPEGTCDDLGTIAGALCRVITYLFFPSQASLNQFSQLKDIVANKPPFGYFTSIKNSLNSLNSTSTPAFVLTSEIENIDIFGTLKTGLTWILWIFFGFWVIKRIARLDF